MRSSFPKPLRIIAGMLTLALFANDFAYAATDIASSKLFAFQTPISAPDLPYSTAVTEEIFPSKSPYFIYLIQDAHTNPSAQKNISKAVEHLVRTEKIKTIFLEGGFGDDSLSSFRSIEPTERKRTAEAYLEKGELSGAEYLDLLSDEELQLWGVEDKALYTRSIENYSKIAKNRSKFHAYLKKISQTIETLKPRIYRPSLQAFDRKCAEYRSQRVSVAEHYQALLAEAKIRNIPMEYYPHLSALGELAEKERGIDFKKAESEQHAAMLELSDEERKDLEDRAPKKIDSKHPKESSAFYALMEESLRPRGGDKRFPELFRYFDYLKLWSSINVRKVSEEEKLIEKQVYAALAISEDEKDLVRADEMTRELGRLFDLTLTPGEFEAYQNDSHSFDISYLTGFLNRKIMDLDGFYERAVFLEDGFKDFADLAAEFYELTRQRDEHFLLKVLQKMKEAGESKAVLITGGYHAPNLISLLKAQDIGFVSIAPQVLHSTNLKRYEKILLSAAFTDEQIAPVAVMDRPQGSPHLDQGDLLAMIKERDALLDSSFHHGYSGAKNKKLLENLRRGTDDNVPFEMTFEELKRRHLFRNMMRFQMLNAEILKSLQESAGARLSSRFSADLFDLGLDIADYRNGLRSIFERYTDRRHVLTSSSLILKGATGLTGTALLLGLGIGSDYTIGGLEALARQFKRIVVVDIDLGTIENTLSRLDASLRRKFEAREVDLSHLVAKVEAFVKGPSLNAPYVSALHELMKRLQAWSKKLKDTADLEFSASYVVSSLIASQLAYFPEKMLEEFLRLKLSAAPESQKESPNDTAEIIIKKIEEFRILVQEKHILDLRSWVRPSGRVYFADTVERMEYNATGDAGVLTEKRRDKIVSQKLWDAIDLWFTAAWSYAWNWDVTLPSRTTGGGGYAIKAKLLSPIHQGEWAMRQAMKAVSGARLAVHSYTLLSQPHQRYLKNVKEAVNADNRPLKIIYGGAGVDLSSSLLGLNFSQGYFVSQYFGLTVKDLERIKEYLSMTDEELASTDALGGFISAYQSSKYNYGFGNSEYLNMKARIVGALVIELKSAGISEIEIDSDQGHPRIRFNWAYPGAKEALPRLVTFIDADVTDPDSYPKFLKETVESRFDVYYQRAGFTIPMHYSGGKFIPYLASHMKDGGHFVTDDHGFVSFSETPEPASLVDFSDDFPIKGYLQIPIPNEQKWIAELYSGRTFTLAGNYYGWKLNIRRKPELNVFQELKKLDKNFVIRIPRGPHVLSNEVDTEKMLVALNTAARTREPRLHVGFSGFLNLDIMAARQSDYGILLDINDREMVLWDIVSQCLSTAPTPEDFIDQFMEMAKVKDSEKPGYFFEKLIVLADDGSTDVNPPVELFREQFEMRRPSGERVILWLRNQQNYDHVRQMFLENRLVYFRANLLDVETFKTISLWVRENVGAADSIYTSNIREWITGRRSPKIKVADPLANNEKFNRSIAEIAGNETYLVEAERTAKSRDRAVVFYTQYGARLAEAPQALLPAYILQAKPRLNKPAYLVFKEAVGKGRDLGRLEIQVSAIGRMALNGAYIVNASDGRRKAFKKGDPLVIKGGAETGMFSWMRSRRALTESQSPNELVMNFPMKGYIRLTASGDEVDVEASEDMSGVTVTMEYVSGARLTQRLVNLNLKQSGNQLYQVSRLMASILPQIDNDIVLYDGLIVKPSRSIPYLIERIQAEILIIMNAMQDLGELGDFPKIGSARMYLAKRLQVALGLIDTLFDVFDALKVVFSPAPFEFTISSLVVRWSRESAERALELMKQGRSSSGARLAAGNHRIGFMDGSVRSVSFSPDGESLLVNPEREGAFYRVDRQLSSTPNEFSDAVDRISDYYKVIYAPDGKHALAASEDHSIYLWDLETRRIVRRFMGHRHIVRALAYSPDGSQFLSGSADGTVILWNASTGQIVHELNGHSETVSSVAFSPDGKYGVSGSFDQSARLWDLRTGASRIVFGRGNEGTIWGGLRSRPLAERGPVYSVAFHPNSRYVLTGHALSSSGRNLVLWDITDGHRVMSYEHHRHTVSSAIFAPDGKYIFSGSFDGTIGVWNTETGELLRQMSGHETGIQSIDFTERENSIASGSGDNTFRIWSRPEIETYFADSSNEMRVFLDLFIGDKSQTFDEEVIDQLETVNFRGRLKFFDYYLGFNRYPTFDPSGRLAEHAKRYQITKVGGHPLLSGHFRGVPIQDRSVRDWARDFDARTRNKKTLNLDEFLDIAYKVRAFGDEDSGPVAEMILEVATYLFEGTYEHYATGARLAEKTRWKKAEYSNIYANGIRVITPMTGLVEGQRLTLRAFLNVVLDMPEFRGYKNIYEIEKKGKITLKRGGLAYEFSYSEPPPLSDAGIKLLRIRPFDYLEKGDRIEIAERYSETKRKPRKGDELKLGALAPYFIPEEGRVRKILLYEKAPDADSGARLAISALDNKEIMFRLPGDPGHEYKAFIRQDLIGAGILEKEKGDSRILIVTRRKDGEEKEYPAAFCAGILPVSEKDLFINWAMVLDYPGLAKYGSSSGNWEYDMQRKFLASYWPSGEIKLEDAPANLRRIGLTTAMFHILTSFYPVGSKLQTVISNPETLADLRSGTSFEETLVGGLYQRAGYQRGSIISPADQAVSFYTLEKVKNPPSNVRWIDRSLLGPYLMAGARLALSTEDEELKELLSRADELLNATHEASRELLEDVKRDNPIMFTAFVTGIMAYPFLLTLMQAPFALMTWMAGASIFMTLFIFRSSLRQNEMNSVQNDYERIADARDDLVRLQNDKKMQGARLASEKKPSRKWFIAAMAAGVIGVLSWFAYERWKASSSPMIEKINFRNGFRIEIKEVEPDGERRRIFLWYNGGFTEVERYFLEKDDLDGGARLALSNILPGREGSMFTQDFASSGRGSRWFLAGAAITLYTSLAWLSVLWAKPEERTLIHTMLMGFMAIATIDLGALYFGRNGKVDLRQTAWTAVLYGLTNGFLIYHFYSWIGQWGVITQWIAASIYSNFIGIIYTFILYLLHYKIPSSEPSIYRDEFSGRESVKKFVNSLMNVWWINVIRQGIIQAWPGLEPTDRAMWAMLTGAMVATFQAFIINSTQFSFREWAKSVVVRLDDEDTSASSGARLAMPDAKLLSQGLEPFGIRPWQVKAALRKFYGSAVDYDRSYGFSHINSGLQKDMIEKDLEGVIRGSRDKKITVYHIGLGKAPREMLEFIESIYKKLADAGEDASAWKIRVIGLDATPSSLKAAEKVLDIKKPNLKVAVMYADARYLETLSAARKILEREWGESLPANYIFERHVGYSNDIASTLDYFIKHGLDRLLGSYIVSSNCLNAFAKTQTRYILEPSNFLGDWINDHKMRTAHFVGAKAVTVKDVFPEKLPSDYPESGIANRGTGIQIISYIDPARTMTFADHIKGMRNSLIFKNAGARLAQQRTSADKKGLSVMKIMLTASLGMGAFLAALSYSYREALSGLVQAYRIEKKDNFSGLTDKAIVEEIHKMHALRQNTNEVDAAVGKWSTEFSRYLTDSSERLTERRRMLAAELVKRFLEKLEPGKKFSPKSPVVFPQGIENNSDGYFVMSFSAANYFLEIDLRFDKPVIQIVAKADNGARLAVNDPNVWFGDIEGSLDKAKSEQEAWRIINNQLYPLVTPGEPFSDDLVATDAFLKAAGDLIREYWRKKNWNQKFGGPSPYFAAIQKDESKGFTNLDDYEKRESKLWMLVENGSLEDKLSFLWTNILFLSSHLQSLGLHLENDRGVSRPIDLILLMKDAKKYANYFIEWKALKGQSPLNEDVLLWGFAAFLDPNLYRIDPTGPLQTESAMERKRLEAYKKYLDPAIKTDEDFWRWHLTDIFSNIDRAEYLPAILQTIQNRTALDWFSLKLRPPFAVRGALMWGSESMPEYIGRVTDFIAAKEIKPLQEQEHASTLNEIRVIPITHLVGARLALDIHSPRKVSAALYPEWVKKSLSTGEDRFKKMSTNIRELMRSQVKTDYIGRSAEILGELADLEKAYEEMQNIGSSSLEIERLDKRISTFLDKCAEEFGILFRYIKEKLNRPFDPVTDKGTVEAFKLKRYSPEAINSFQTTNYPKAVELSNKLKDNFNTLGLFIFLQLDDTHSPFLEAIRKDLPEYIKSLKVEETKSDAKAKRALNHLVKSHLGKVLRVYNLKDRVSAPAKKDAADHATEMLYAEFRDEVFVAEAHAKLFQGLQAKLVRAMGAPGQLSLKAGQSEALVELIKEMRFTHAHKGDGNGMDQVYQNELAMGLRFVSFIGDIATSEADLDILLDEYKMVTGLEATKIEIIVNYYRVLWKLYKNGEISFDGSLSKMRELEALVDAPQKISRILHTSLVGIREYITNHRASFESKQWIVFTDGVGRRHGQEFNFLSAFSWFHQRIEQRYFPLSGAEYINAPGRSSLETDITRQLRSLANRTIAREVNNTFSAPTIEDAPTTYPNDGFVDKSVVMAHLAVESQGARLAANGLSKDPSLILQHYRAHGYLETLRRLRLKDRQYAFHVRRYLASTSDDTDYFALTKKEADIIVRNKTIPYGTLQSQTSAKNLILAALDAIPGFERKRNAGDVAGMAQLYRKHVIGYWSHMPLKKGRTRQHGQISFFRETAGLGSLLDNTHAYMSKKKSSPAALLRFALPSIMDVRIEGSLDPLEVERSYWNDADNVRHHLLLALDSIPGFKKAREEGDDQMMAVLYRRHVIHYHNGGHTGYEWNGQTAFFFDNGLRNALSKRRIYLSGENRYEALLSLVLPGLIREEGEGYLRSRELKVGPRIKKENANGGARLAATEINMSRRSWFASAGILFANLTAGAQERDVKASADMEVENIDTEDMTTAQITLLRDHASAEEIIRGYMKSEAPVISLSQTSQNVADLTAIFKRANPAIDGPDKTKKGAKFDITEVREELFVRDILQRSAVILVQRTRENGRDIEIHYIRGSDHPAVVTEGSYYYPLNRDVVIINVDNLMARTKTDEKAFISQLISVREHELTHARTFRSVQRGAYNKKLLEIPAVAKEWEAIRKSQPAKSKRLIARAKTELPALLAEVAQSSDPKVIMKRFIGLSHDSGADDYTSPSRILVGLVLNDLGSLAKDRKQDDEEKAIDGSTDEAIRRAARKWYEQVYGPLPASDTKVPAEIIHYFKEHAPAKETGLCLIGQPFSEFSRDASGSGARLAVLNGLEVSGTTFIPDLRADLLVLRNVIPQLKNSSRVLDLGTGSGNLTHIMARETKEVAGISFVAVDINTDAVNNAGVNLSVFPNVRVIHSDLFSNIAVRDQFDVIVSNPPWFSENLKQNKGPSHNAATVDPNYRILKSFFVGAPAYLSREGRIYLIFRRANEAQLVMIANSHGFALHRKDGIGGMALYEGRRQDQITYQNSGARLTLSFEKWKQLLWLNKWHLAGYLFYTVLLTGYAGGTLLGALIKNLDGYLAPLGIVLHPVYFLTLAVSLGMLMLPFIPFARLLKWNYTHEMAQRYADSMHQELIEEADKNGDKLLSRALRSIKGVEVLETSLAKPWTIVNFGRLIYGGKDSKNKKVLLTREFVLPYPIFKQTGRYLIIRRAIGFDYDARAEEITRETSPAAKSITGAIWWGYGSYENLIRLRYYPALLPFLIAEPTFFAILTFITAPIGIVANLLLHRNIKTVLYAAGRAVLPHQSVAERVEPAQGSEVGARLADVRSHVYTDAIRAGYKSPSSTAEAFSVALKPGAFALDLRTTSKRDSRPFTAEEEAVFEHSELLTPIADIPLSRNEIASVKLTYYNRVSGSIELRCIVTASDGRRFYSKVNGFDTSALDAFKNISLDRLEDLRAPDTEVQASMGNQTDLAGNLSFLSDGQAWQVYSASDDAWDGKWYRALVEFRDGTRKLGEVRALRGESGEPQQIILRTLDGEEKMLEPVSTKFALVAYVLGWGDKSSSDLLYQYYVNADKGGVAESDIRHLFNLPILRRNFLFYAELASSPEQLRNAFTGQPVTFSLPADIPTADIVSALKEYGYAIKPGVPVPASPGDFWVSNGSITMMLLHNRYPVNALAVSGDGRNVAIVNVLGLSGRQGADYWTLFDWVKKELPWAYALFALDNGMDPTVWHSNSQKPYLVEGRKNINAVLLARPSGARSATEHGGPAQDSETGARLANVEEERFAELTQVFRPELLLSVPADGSIYEPTKWAFLSVVFEEIQKAVGTPLKGKKYLAMGSGDLRDAAVAGYVHGMQVTSAEKDRNIATQAAAYAALPKNQKFFTNVDLGAPGAYTRDVFDLSWKDIDVMYFYYTEPYPGDLEFRRRFMRKVREMKPGALVAILYESAYLHREEDDNFLRGLLPLAYGASYKRLAGAVQKVSQAEYPYAPRLRIYRVPFGLSTENAGTRLAASSKIQSRNAEMLSAKKAMADVVLQNDDVEWDDVILDVQRSLKNKTVGITDNKGVLNFSVGGFNYTWRALGFESGGWTQRIIDLKTAGDSGRRYLELVVRFEKGRKKFERTFQVGRARRVLKLADTNKKIIELSVLDISPSLGVAILNKLVVPSEDVAAAWSKILPDPLDLIGLRIEKTDGSGRVILTPQPYFPYQWSPIGLHQKGWGGVITDARMLNNGSILEFEMQWTKDGKNLEKVYQIAGHRTAIRGVGKQKGNSMQVLEISERPGLIGLSRIITDPRILKDPLNFDWNANARSFPDLANQRMGEVTWGRYNFNPAPNYGYNLNALGLDLNHWEGVIVDSGVRGTGKGYYEFKVAFAPMPSNSDKKNEKGHPKRIVRTFQIGRYTRELAGMNKDRGKSIQVMDISPDLAFNMLIELMTKPSNYDWKKASDLPVLTGMSFGLTGSEGNYRFNPSTLQTYGWAALGSEQGQWTSKIIRSGVENTTGGDFYRFTCEFTSPNGKQTIRRSFQIGPDRKKLTLHKLYAESLSPTKKAPQDVFEIIPVDALNARSGLPAGQAGARLAFSNIKFDVKEKDHISFYEQLLPFIKIYARRKGANVFEYWTSESNEAHEVEVVRNSVQFIIDGKELGLPNEDWHVAINLGTALEDDFVHLMRASKQYSLSDLAGLSLGQLKSAAFSDLRRISDMTQEMMAMNEIFQETLAGEIRSDDFASSMNVDDVEKAVQMIEMIASATGILSKEVAAWGENFTSFLRPNILKRIHRAKSPKDVIDIIKHLRQDRVFVERHLSLASIYDMQLQKLRQRGPAERPAVDTSSTELSQKDFQKDLKIFALKLWLSHRQKDGDKFALAVHKTLGVDEKFAALLSYHYDQAQDKLTLSLDGQAEPLVVVENAKKAQSEFQEEVLANKLTQSDLFTLTQVSSNDTKPRFAALALDQDLQIEIPLAHFNGFDQSQRDAQIRFAKARAEAIHRTNPRILFVFSGEGEEAKKGILTVRLGRIDETYEEASSHVNYAINGLKPGVWADWDGAFYAAAAAGSVYTGHYNADENKINFADVSESDLPPDLVSYLEKRATERTDNFRQLLLNMFRGGKLSPDDLKKVAFWLPLAEKLDWQTIFQGARLAEKTAASSA